MSMIVGQTDAVSEAQLMKRRSVLERRMSVRRMSIRSTQLTEINFIDSSTMYNYILRAIPMKVRNSFVIYDFSSSQSCEGQVVAPLEFACENLIRMSDFPDALSCLEAGYSNFPSILNEIQKKLSQKGQDSLTRRMRVFNFIVVSREESSEVFKIFTKAFKSFDKESEATVGDVLLNSASRKIAEKHILSSISAIAANVNMTASGRIAATQSSEEEMRLLRLGIIFAGILKQSKVRDVFVQRQTTERFFTDYPCMSGNLPRLTTSMTLSLPNEVLLGRFYYGNWKHAASSDVMKITGITHIVNATKEVENYFARDSCALPAKVYHQLPIEDTDDARICEYFDSTYAFLVAALEENPSNKVFVHCAQGKSRSATCVCLFFMRFFGWSFEVAMQYIADKRDIACPNPGFTDQLKEEREKILQDPSTREEKNWKNSLPDIVQKILVEEPSAFAATILSQTMSGYKAQEEGNVLISELTINVEEVQSSTLRQEQNDEEDIDMLSLRLFQKLISKKHTVILPEQSDEYDSSSDSDLTSDQEEGEEAAENSEDNFCAIAGETHVPQ